MPTPNRWTVQDAKARFSELLETSVEQGPQIVTKRGVEMAVVVPISEWQRLKGVTKPTLKELLLAPTPRFDLPISPRGRWRRRPIPKLS